MVFLWLATILSDFQEFELILEYKTSMTITALPQFQNNLHDHHLYSRSLYFWSSLSLSLLPPFHSTFAISFFFVRSSAIFNELVCVWTSPSLAKGIVWLLAELLKENVFLTNYIKFCLESHFSSSSVTNMKTIVKRKKIGSTTNAEMYIWIFTTQFSMSLITIARSSLSSMRSLIFFYFFLSFLVICSVVFVTFRSSQICIQL